MIHLQKFVTTIVKVTYGCNLKCIYCYEARSGAKAGLMNEQTLGNVIKKMAIYHGPGRKIAFIWHGGEPLLAGLDFFKKAIEFQNRFGESYLFSNSIQTNGTLLTDDILNFFVAHDFKMGISLDGPAIIHDQQRPYHNGMGSFYSILKNIEKIRNYEERHQVKILGGVILVLTRLVLEHLDAFYAFARDLKVNIQINPLYFAGRAEEQEGALGISPEVYGKTMIALFDRWFENDSGKFMLSPFDLIIGNMISQQPPHGCQFRGSCFEHFLAVSPTGEVYPCGRWMDNNTFILGNINQGEPGQMLIAPLLQRIARERNNLNDICNDCQFWSICHGGCLNNAYMTHQSLRERDFYCPGYRLLFNHIFARINERVEHADVGMDPAGKLLPVLSALPQFSADKERGCTY